MGCGASSHARPASVTLLESRQAQGSEGASTHHLAAAASRGTSGPAEPEASSSTPAAGPADLAVADAAASRPSAPLPDATQAAGGSSRAAAGDNSAQDAGAADAAAIAAVLNVSSSQRGGAAAGTAATSAAAAAKDLSSAIDSGAANGTLGQQPAPQQPAAPGLVPVAVLSGGLLRVLAAGTPDQLAQPYGSLRLHQTMHVQGLATTATARVPEAFGAKLPAAAAAEVVELLRVRVHVCED